MGIVARCQQLHLGVGRQQIETLRLPARRQMQVDIVAQDAGGDDRVLLVLPPSWSKAW